MNFAKYIWVNKDIYPRLQKCGHNPFVWDRKKYTFGVVAFKKKYVYDKTIKSAEVEVFGDTRYYLWQNDKFVGTGPCSAGGDFKMPYQYSNKFVIDVDSDSIEFLGRVQIKPVQELDVSQGIGCFILEAKLTFEDGSESWVYTDATWLARRENEYLSPWVMDYTKKRDEWKNAVIQENVWNVMTSPIKNLVEKVVSSKEFEIESNMKQEFTVELDKIYSAYSVLDIIASGDYKIEIITSEANGISKKKHIIQGNKSEYYRSNEYYGVGEYKLIVDNKSNEKIRLRSDIVFVCYPSEEQGYFKCSDELLNRIYELGKWTVKICRQYIELDSPVHQENLLCVGDYIIESMVNNYTTGDYSLTRFDLLRRSYLYIASEGYTHNENYAYMWFIWLEDYYKHTGDIAIFEDVLEGMEVVLKRFSEMENEKGLIEYVGGYGFIDWTFIDGHSMFKPPRALGETVTNALYYKSISVASFIYEKLGIADKAKIYKKKAELFKKVFNETFFDEEKVLYFDGLNELSPINEAIPENPEKRYYTRYANTFAVLFGLCEENVGKKIMEWVVRPENLGEAQPYFMHFVFEALTKEGLFKEYGIELIKKWKTLVEDCDKGMHEVIHNYDGYMTDYSHGWGTTPTYQLPAKLLNLEILNAGFKKIHISPNLYGLDWADIKIPTPYGIIECILKKGNCPVITAPAEIDIIID